MVKIRIDGDAKAFEQKLHNLGAIGEKALGGLKAAAAVAGTELLAIGTYALSVGKKFEQSLSGIQAVSGATAQEMAVLRAAALQAGEDTAYSASESARAIEELIKAGLTVEQVIGGGLTGALNLAAAGEIDLASAAEVASTVLNAFRDDGLSVADAANVLAGAANASATDVAGLQMGLSQVSAVASSVGLSFNDTTTSLAVFAQNGLKGSDAGTSLKTMLMNLQPVTDKQVAQFKDLGLVTEDGTNRFFDMQGQMKPLSEIAGILNDSLSGMTDQQRAMALEVMFGSDAIRAANVLYKEGADGINNMWAAMSSVEAADVAAARLDNLAGDIERLQGSAETLGIRLYESFSGSARDAVQGLQTSVAKLNTEIDRPAVRRAIENIGIAFTSLAKTVGNMATAVLPPFIKMLGFVAENMDAILPPSLALAVAFKAYSIINTVSAGLKALQAVTASKAVTDKLAALAVTGNASAIAAQTAVTTANSIATAANNNVHTAATTAQLAWTVLSTSATAAEAANTAAVLINSGAISAKGLIVEVLSGNIKVATAVQWLWNAAMTAHPAAMVVAGVIALTGVLVGLTLAFQRNNEELVAATDRAKELKAEQESMADSVRDSAAAFESNTSSADVNADAASKLVAKIREISASNDDAAVKSARLRAAVDQLNQVMPELGISFNETTGEVVGLTDATDDYIASLKESVKAEMLRDRAVELTKEQVAAEIERAKVMAEMDELETAGLATYEQYVQATGEYQTRSTAAYAEMEAAVAGYNEIINRTGTELEELNPLITESSDASRESAESFTYSEENLQSLAEQYGTTVEAIRAATDGTVESMDAWVAAQDEAAAATAEATEAMAAEIEENLNRVAEAYQTSNDRIDLSNATSLENRIANIANNQRLSDEYAANIAYLGDQVGTELDAGLLAELQRGDAEAMALAQQMVDSLKAGDQKWAELNGYYQNNADTAITTLAEGMTFTGENPGAAMVNEVAAAIAEGSGVISEAASTAGSGAVEGLQSSISSGAPASVGSNMVTEAASGVSGNGSLQAASQASGQEAIAAVDGAIESGNPVGIGRNFIEDIATGIRNTKPTLITAAKSAVTDAVTAAKNAGTVSITRPIGVAMVTGIASGVSNTQSTLVSAARTAVTSAVSAASSAGSASATYSIGSNMMQGITNGVNAGASGVVNAMVSAVEQAISAARATAEINSPSKRMRREVGLGLGEGLALGIEDSTQDAVQAATEQMQDVLGAYDDPGTLTLQTRFLAEFGDVPLKFFETGRLAGEQFVAGFNIAAMGFMAMLENIIVGRPPVSVGNTGKGQVVGGDININFNQPVNSPDAYARSVRGVFEYGLAGDRS